jgi:hypothetical protein
MSSLFLQVIHPSPLPSHEISGRDLSDIHSLGMRHGLFPLVYARLRNFRNSSANPNEIDKYLQKKENLYLKNASRSAQQEALGNEILSILNNNGVQAMVLRGTEIAKEIYDDQDARTSSDIDILIKISDALWVDTILSKAGYRRNDSIPLEFWFYRIHHAIYSDHGRSDLIEIHWNFGIPSFFNLSSEEIWEGVASTDSGQVKLLPEMCMIMLLVHHHMHSFRELRILIDILWALNKYDTMIDWQLFALKIRRIGLVKTTRIALNQIHMLWIERSQEIGSIQTLQHELEKIGVKEPKALLSFFEMDVSKHYSFRNYKDMLMARFALDKGTIVLLSFIKTLFPMAQAIKALYRDERNWSLPLNYVKFISWRIREWTGI